MRTTAFFSYRKKIVIFENWVKDFGDNCENAMSQHSLVYQQPSSSLDSKHLKIKIKTMASENSEKIFQGVNISEGSTTKMADRFSRTDLYFVCRIGAKESKWEDKGFEVKSDVQKARPNEKVTWDAKFCYQKKAGVVMEMEIRLMDKDHCTKDDFLDGATITVPDFDTTVTIKEQFEEKSGEVTVQFYQPGKYTISLWGSH